MIYASNILYREIPDYFRFEVNSRPHQTLLLKNNKSRAQYKRVIIF